MRLASPLRYPGGKWRIAPFFEKLIALNYRRPPVYVEPFGGGGSLALSLLYSGAVSRVLLNDLDPAINSFWQSVLHRHQAFLRMLETVPLTSQEWHRQREIHRRGMQAGTLAFGFSTFFLNRTNHSGIMNAGMIGGKNQSGEWRLDARFNRTDLAERIRRVVACRARISVGGCDALDFIAGQQKARSSVLFYLDPPYYVAGPDLYLNAYHPHDHSVLRDATVSLNHPWVVSYDDVQPVRRLYDGRRSRKLLLMHTARSPRVGREVLFFSDSLRIPRRATAS